MLTSDGQEAEIALPATAIAPGFARSVSFAADSERSALLRRLDSPHTLQGYSTHLSITTPQVIGEQVATAFASRFAAPMMMLLDRPTSPGLLVRPRPRRTEIGGEYATGRQLMSALIFAVAAVRACIAMVTESRELTSPVVQANVVAATDRFGWYVDRTAFGDDLYRAGRRTLLRTEDSRTIAAQEVLECAWDCVRPFIACSADPAELSGVDRIVSGQAALSIDESGHELVEAGADSTDIHASRSCEDDVNPQLRPRRRPAAKLELAPVMVTWESVIFLLIGKRRRRRAFAAVPRRLLPRFVELLEAGELDGILGNYLQHARGDRVLSSHEQSLSPGLFDRVTSRGALLPSERDPSEQVAFHAA